MLVDPRQHTHAHIYFYGVHEPPNTRLIRRISHPGWSILDVGANVGYYSVLALDVGGPGSRVDAFEPNPATYALLRRTAALTSADRPLNVVQAAISDREGETALHLSADRRNSGMSSLVGAMPGVGSNIVLVRTLTLDGYCDSNGLSPDLVKIDVEGAENLVILGMRGLLKRRVPTYVLCELADDPERPPPSQVIEEFASHGYVARSVDEDGTLCRFRDETVRAPLFELCFVRQ